MLLGSCLDKKRMILLSYTKNEFKNLHTHLDYFYYLSLQRFIICDVSRVRRVLSLDGFSEIVRARLINSHSCTTYKIERLRIFRLGIITVNTFRGSAGYAHNLITTDFRVNCSVFLTSGIFANRGDHGEQGGGICAYLWTIEGSTDRKRSSPHCITLVFLTLPSCSELCREIESEPGLRSGVIKRSALRL